VNNDFSLRLFKLFLSSGPVKYSLEGEIIGKNLNLTMISGKNKNQTTLKLKEVPYLANAIKPYVLKHGLEAGKRYRLPFFDPSTLSRSEIDIEVTGMEKMLHRDKPVMTYRLKECFKGIETIVWVSEAGETLREESPLGMALVKENREIALSGDWMKGTTRDIVVTTAVPVDTKIDEARNINFLKIKLSNISLEGFQLDGGRQKLVGQFLEIQQENPGLWKSYALPVTDEALKWYLQPTLLIQSDNERIVKLAENITGNVRDAEKASRMLLHWVYEKMEKKPTMSIPNSLGVLDLMAGDCNEHTTLFTALSRSVGIPTRICIGIVYMNDSFYYHAWPEIFLGWWVAVDPTFNQFPADATHIRFVVGDLSEQIKIIKIVGFVKVEIVKYS